MDPEPVDGFTWRLGRRYTQGGVTWAVECGTCAALHFDHDTRADARAWLTKHRANRHALDWAPAPMVQMPASVTPSVSSKGEMPRSRRAS